MRTLLLSLLFPALFTAQKHERFKNSPKEDTIKKQSSELSVTGKQKLYKILTVKPKDTSLYMALKQPPKHYPMDHILNSLHAEKSKNIKTKP